jgi:hypothetical protein
MQALRIDPFVGHARDHAHVLHLECGAVDPARGLAQAPPGLLGLALKQRDGARGRLGAGAFGGEPAAMEGGVRHAPFGAPAVGREGGALAFVDEEFGHVEADAARADDRHPRSHRRAAAQHVDIGQDVRAVLPRDAGVARQDAGGDDDLVEAREVVRGRGRAEPQRHAGGRELGREPVDEAVELFLARDRAGHVELPADADILLEQRDANGPATAATIAAVMPAGPAPTTATVLRTSAGA